MAPPWIVQLRAMLAQGAWLVTAARVLHRTPHICDRSLWVWLGHR